MSNKDDAKKLIDVYFEHDKFSDNDIDKILSDMPVLVDVFFDGQNIKELNPGDISKNT